jgi:hypothetical protein
MNLFRTLLLLTIINKSTQMLEISKLTYYLLNNVSKNVKPIGDRRKFIRGWGIIKTNAKKYNKKNVFLANNKICQNCTHFNRYQIKTEVFAVVRLQILLLTVRLIFSKGGANVPSCLSLWAPMVKPIPLFLQLNILSNKKKKTYFLCCVLL